MITLRNYDYKQVAVFGLSKSGVTTVASLLASGIEVFAWDDNPETRQNFAKLYKNPKLSLSIPEEWQWQTIQLLVLSPGIPFTNPEPHEVVKTAGKFGVKIIGDIELFCDSQPHIPKIAVTGTNGKSTTTSLIAHILKSAGFKVEVGGNLGPPVLSLQPVGNDGCYVLELSSYQLDLVENAHFNIALILNVTPDHLDRHGSIERYVEAKSHIFDRQNKRDVAIIGIDDDYSRSIYSALKQISKAKIIPISVIQKLNYGVFVDKSGVLLDKTDPENLVEINLGDIATLTGRHNWQNAAFAYTACKSYGVSAREIEKGLKTFPGLKHRMQTVATIHGVRFINDSKATNADATSHALKPFSNIYWIVGGKPKEGGIESLHGLLGGVAHAFLIGESEDKFAAFLEGKVNYTKCGTLDKAFAAASGKAFSERRQNSVVLLSPACASFDQWKSFEERGDAFCKMTDNLLQNIVFGKR
ncbi:MAG: UDP-N-acetylmuramoyl-L-alanine--D-glutamate ligase [Pseudomonadota bacterium]